MRTSLGEKTTEWAVVGFLWGFRILIIAIVILGTIGTIRAGKYSQEAWVNFVVLGIAQGSIYALIALGYTMVYGILRMINFAHGEIFMSGAFGAYFLADYMSKTGFLNQYTLVALLALMLLAMGISTVVALLVERVAYRPLRGAPRLVPLISAIGASYFLQYTARGFFGSNRYSYPAVAALEGKWEILGFSILKTHAIVIIAAIVMMAILYVIVMRTKVGKAMRAVSEDKDVAALMGIDVNRIIVTTFGIGAAMAGAAGLLFALAYRQVYFLMGFIPGIKAFTCAVLGGIGNIPGAMLGGLLLGVTESVGPALFLEGIGIPRPYQLHDVIAFTMLVMVLLFRPSGLLGERITAKKA
jgi:branched-chain amino acid transport system permease protein